MSPGDIPQYDNAFLQGLEKQGFILPGEIPQYDEALWHGLVKKGYFEGRNIRIDIRATADRFPERAPEFAADLVREGVDVLFVATPPEAQAAAQAVRQSSKRIPIVFGPVVDPVGAGLVQSFARPGGDITGLAYYDSELVGKQLELLKDAFPKLSKVAYLHEPLVLPPAHSATMKDVIRSVARAKRIRLTIFEVRTPVELEKALSEIARSRPRGIVVMHGPLLVASRQRIIGFASKQKLPAMYGGAIFVEDGGLMFYGTPFSELYGRAASVVAKVLRGAKPSDIPVEQPYEYKLLVNWQTAKNLPVMISEQIQLIAQRIDTSQ